MKKNFLFLVCFALTMAGSVTAQGNKPEGGNGNRSQTMKAERKFKIIVDNLDYNKAEERQLMLAYNNELNSMQETVRSGRGLLDLLYTGYTTAFNQKTVDATSRIINMGMSLLSSKDERERWYRTAQQHCQYTKILKTENKIYDFYSQPSLKGAMDPENLSFDGFGCRNYIELTESPGFGKDVFYVYCKMKRDKEGISHIVNHSKFLVDIDSLCFYPSYCNLPNDSIDNMDSRFSFEKRDNLVLSINVKIYSSWLTQAIILQKDQLLGEFVITARIDKTKLNDNGAFIYKKGDPDYEQLVDVTGDCFIVPRSFTGTTDAKTYDAAWGTGQYRIEMEVFENCDIVDSYYQKHESDGNEIASEVNTVPYKIKWDKDKWKPEWKLMNSHNRNKTSFWNKSWQCIISAYKGNGWQATLTDPFTTALYSFETTQLKNLFDDIYIAAPATTTGNSFGGAATGTISTKPTGARP